MEFVWFLAIILPTLAVMAFMGWKSDERLWWPGRADRQRLFAFAAVRAEAKPGSNSFALELIGEPREELWVAAISWRIEQAREWEGDRYFVEVGSAESPNQGVWKAGERRIVESELSVDEAKLPLGRPARLHVVVTAGAEGDVHLFGDVRRAAGQAPRFGFRRSTG